MLATYYPLWFTLALWAIDLIPLYPGALLCLVALIKFIRDRPGAARMTLIGVVLLALAACLMAWNKGGIISGASYHLS